MGRFASARIALIGSAALVWMTLQMPKVASACAVCSTGRDDENQLAFLLSTIFMSILPLLVIGSIGYVLWRRIQRFEAEQSARPRPAAHRVTATPPSAVGSTR